MSLKSSRYRFKKALKEQLLNWGDSLLSPIELSAVTVLYITYLKIRNNIEVIEEQKCGGPSNLQNHYKVVLTLLKCSYNLLALDDRVDFRLFTTIPYFYEVYKGKFFTDKFEKVRLFETIQCQDALFKLSSVSAKNAEVAVVEATDKKILDRSHAELRTWNDLINRFGDI